MTGESTYRFGPVIRRELAGLIERVESTDEKESS